MNVKRIVTGTLAAAAVLLGACGDDDNKTSLKEQFTFDGETLSLKDANIFLVDDGTALGTHNYREYVITDGASGGSGTTYYIDLELATPDDGEVEEGDYPLFYNWDLAAETSNIGYVYAQIGDDDEDEDYVEFDVVASAAGDDEVVVSGGTDDGENMTIKYNGSIRYYHFDGEDWVTETITGKFNVKGKVQDISSAPAKVKLSRAARAH